MEELSEGSRVEVDVKNDSPLGGSTQLASFVVTELHVDRIVGEDPNWGDECVISGVGTDTVEYSDAGKSGEVVEARVVDTHDEIPIHDSGSVVV